MFGTDAPWHFWTPELIRRIAGARQTVVPPVPLKGGLWLHVNAWGPLLPLLHFHLGWEHVGAGLARWSATGFDHLNDRTLTVVHDQWGTDGLRRAAEWSGGFHALEMPAPLMKRQEHLPGVGYPPAGLHLEAHWQAARPYAEPDKDGDGDYERRELGKGRLLLIFPKYGGWYRGLEEVGGRLSPLPDGRSWRVGVAIAPIGFVGTFRKSRVSGKWFTGRHKAHSLGLDPTRSVACDVTDLG